MENDTQLNQLRPYWIGGHVNKYQTALDTGRGVGNKKEEIYKEGECLKEGGK